jgi:multidrug resistance efflux pump
MKFLRHIIRLTLIFVLLIVTTACDIMLEDSGNKDGLQASGVVEAIEIVIAPEIGGRVTTVWVSEGDQVKPGEPLFQIGDELLLSQLHQAESALNVAEANYDMVVAGLTKEQKKAGIAAAELALASSEYDLEKLFEDTNLLAAQALEMAENLEQELENLHNPEYQQALALKAIADAKKAIENAERRLNSVGSSADDADIAAAEAQVVLSRDELEDAEEDFEPYEHKPEDNLQRANYQAKLASAQQVYDAAVRKLNALRGTGSPADIAVAEADLVATQAQLLDAEREWERIKDGPQKSDIALLEAQVAKAFQDYEMYKNGPDPDDVALANAQVENAKAQLALAKAEIPTQEEINIAQAQMTLARSNLELIQVQIDRLVVKSMMGGVVMTRSIEPGEIIQPGQAAMTIGQLDHLTVTVYIPEDKYGQIKLGGTATLTADSFPDKTFSGIVTRIADRAEYTPRNVQTKEDRQTTVFAIELSVSDPDGYLKPGMPIDVIFQ